MYSVVMMRTMGIHTHTSTMNLTQIEEQVTKDGMTNYEIITRLRYKTPDGYTGSIVQVKSKPKETHGKELDGKDKTSRKTI